MLAFDSAVTLGQTVRFSSYKRHSIQQNRTVIREKKRKNVAEYL